MPETTVTTPDERTAAAAEHKETETALESLASICTVLAVGLFVMTFIFQNFEIPSGSMEKTLLIGDHVLVDRISFAPPSRWFPLVHYREPRRGDIIVFLKPHPETPDLHLVKRCIGIPGDHIHLEHGVVYLNGVAQNEPYAGMPRDDGDPADAYIHYRDDFPSDLPGIEQAASDSYAALWAVDLPNHIVNRELAVPPRRRLRHVRQPHQVGRQPLLGLRPAREHRGPPHVRLLVLPDPRGSDEQDRCRRPHCFMGHVLIHIFD